MKSKIVWFTGLSGSGKTTLANYIFKKLKFKSSKLQLSMVIFLEKKQTKKFTKKSIIKNNISIINYLDKKKSKVRLFTCISNCTTKENKISSVQKFNSNYFEVFTKCSLKELIRRDTKIIL